MKKFLVMMCVALLGGAGVSACGNDAGFEAIVIGPGDTTLAGDLDSLDEVLIVGGVQFLVQKTSSDITPVPDAKISVQSGAIQGDIIMCLVPWTFAGVCTKPSLAAGGLAPDGGAVIINTRTDDNGTVLVYPKLVVRDCSNPLTSGTLDGTGSVAAVISASTAVWNLKFTVAC